MGLPNTINIHGSNFRENNTLLCYFKNPTGTQISYEKALILNDSLAVCTATPIYDQALSSLVLSVIEQSTNNIIQSQILKFTRRTSIQIYEIIPRAVFHSITDVFVTVLGDQIQENCKCVFGNLTSPVTVYVDSSTILCLVPSLFIKDRFEPNRNLKGFNTFLYLACPQ